jgi:1-acyl-sn-glycerol-3-phosphate acyltransferase
MACKLLAAWGLVVFTITLLIFVWPVAITYLLPEPLGTRIFQFLSRIWMGFFLWCIGCRIIIRGKENYDHTEQYVVTCNHRSMLDVVLMTPFFPGPNKTIAKKSLAKIPLFGWVYARGSVLVDRGSDASRRRSFDLMRKVLIQDRLNMIIYPEGTRNRGDEPLKPFKDGAFRLAVDCKKKIIPVIMFRTALAMPPHRKFYLTPQRLVMHILPPVDSEGLTAAELKHQVFADMWIHLERNKDRITD